MRGVVIVDLKKLKMKGKSMSRLIDAEAITDHEIIDYLGIRYASCLDDVRDMLNDQPTIEARQVVHGEWIKSDLLFEADKCTICNASIYNTDGMNFCPNCGADMRKGGADSE